MRELRKETETSETYSFVGIKNLEIRNERTPKGDGNIKELRILKYIMINKK